MKLTDIDLSSLAEVAAAVTLLEHVHRELATGGTPLPELIVNPAHLVTPGTPVPFVAKSAWVPSQKLATGDAVEVEGLGAGTVGETMMTPFARQQAAPISDDATRFGCAGSSFGFPTPADAEKLRGLGVDPITAQPLATGDAVVIQGLGVGTIGEAVTSMDAASVFGGAPAQSAAPLSQPAPSTVGAAASPTAPAAPPASGALPTLPALAPLPAPSAAAPAAPAAPASPAGGVELDADGLPWDERIHAGTKRKNADGRWTSKRGINDPDLVSRVVAQLRAQMAAGGLIRSNLPAQPAAMPTLPEQPVLPANPTSTLAALQAAMTPVVAQSAAPLPVSTPAPSTQPLVALPVTNGPASLAAPSPSALPASPTPAAPPQSSAPAPTTFQDFMTALTVEVQAGRVPIEALGAACQPLGGVSALNAKPELIPVAWASLKAKYPGML